MDDLIKALENTLSSKNWYGSIFIALSVPDICGYLEDPNKSSQKRYEQWFERYMLEKYTGFIGASNTPHTFLSASDCYALRCALFHQGWEDIADQRARQTLERFHFTEPPIRGGNHCNQFNNVLQIQIDIFCNDILDGLREWIRDVDSSSEVKTRMSRMMKIYSANDIPGVVIGH